MIIKNNKNGLISVGYSVPVEGQKNPDMGFIKLVPGCNDVNKSLWLKSRNGCERHLKSGALVELFASETSEKGEGNSKGTKKITYKEFADLTNLEADEVIKSTYNVETLNTWKRTESRDSIRAAIMQQIESVLNYTAKKAS